MLKLVLNLSKLSELANHWHLLPAIWLSVCSRRGKLCVELSVTSKWVTKAATATMEEHISGRIWQYLNGGYDVVSKAHAVLQNGCGDSVVYIEVLRSNIQHAALLTL